MSILTEILKLQKMGLFSSSEREYHKDGSYTDRNERTGSSSTYDEDGKLREFSITKVPIIGPNHVDTYDRDGNLTNVQYPSGDYDSSSSSSDGGSGK